jgi:hemerythrin
MTYIEWDASHELGFSQIDQEHCGLHLLINQLFDVVFGDWTRNATLRACGGRAAAIEAAFQALRVATAEHFESEEALMLASDFPGMRTHAEQHLELLEQLDSFARHFHSTHADSLPHTVRFLREWFEFHIDTYDRALVRWLKTGDASPPAEPD